MNSWFQGKVTINDEDHGYESDLGLEGVWGSIAEIEEYFQNKDNALSYFQFLEDLE
jgi:hypothetical protein